MKISLKSLISSLPFRLGLTFLWLFSFVGVALEWLPFQFVWLEMLLALILPFCWPRQFGSWPGLLTVVALTWTPAIMLGDSGLDAEGTLASFAMSLMLSSLMLSPATILLLIRRRDASVAIVLTILAILPAFVVFLFVQIGGALGNEALQAMTWTGRSAWMSLWHLMVGLCFGAVGFLISLIWLIVRELRSEQRV